MQYSEFRNIIIKLRERSERKGGETIVVSRHKKTLYANKDNKQLFALFNILLFFNTVDAQYRCALYEKLFIKNIITVVCALRTTSNAYIDIDTQKLTPRLIKLI